MLICNFHPRCLGTPPKMFGQYCPRCLRTTAQDVCALLPKMFGQHCPRCLRTTTQGVCALLPKMFGQHYPRCLRTTAQGVWAHFSRSLPVFDQKRISNLGNKKRPPGGDRLHYYTDSEISMHSVRMTPEHM
jgi:hypothetical protein